MSTLDIHTNGDNAWSDLKDQRERIIHVPDGPLSIVMLQDGMTSGASSVAIRIDLPNGKVVIAETSLALFLTAADVFRAKNGETTA